MRNELTNLLPSERRDALMRDYYVRLAVVATWFASSLIIVSMALLAPTYVFLAANARSKEAHLANVVSTLSSAGDAALSARIAALSKNAAALSALAQASAASKIVRAALAIPRPGVALSGFAFTPKSAKGPGVLSISGTAATRDALRGYQLSLEKASFARSANLPVSAYAKDSDIAFTITVTLSP
ncbi:hypothetical protein HY972_01265 [Candidatus Kaiserbacteria bacterium]|nr:hypothetical protein [Candidatus Kaiserbacteria bacterium]